VSFSVVDFLTRRIVDGSLVGFESFDRGDDSIIGVCDVEERKPCRSFD